MKGTRAHLLPSHRSDSPASDLRHSIKSFSEKTQVTMASWFLMFLLFFYQAAVGSAWRFDYYDDPFPVFPPDVMDGAGEGPTGICHEFVRMMYCRCDNSKKDISCHIFNDSNTDDAVWDLFALPEVENITRLSLASHIEGILKFVPSKALANLPMLKTVEFKYGDISKVKSNAFSELGKLETIDLSGNNIDKLQENAFIKLPNIREIQLQQNFLSEIRKSVFVDLPKLKVLLLDRNNISVIEEGAFTDLQALNELELWGNQIQTLSRLMFHGLRHLHRLDLNMNEIKVLSGSVFSEMPHLHEIILSYNKIESVDDDAFVGLHNLMTLRLNSNNLFFLPDGLFSHLPKLMSLDLRENDLRHLNKPVITTLPNLHNTSAYIHIQGNPFICDCKIQWMVQLLNETPNTNLQNELHLVTCTPSKPEAEAVIQSILNGNNITMVEGNSERRHLDLQETKPILITEFAAMTSQQACDDVDKIKENGGHSLHMTMSLICFSIFVISIIL